MSLFNQTPNELLASAINSHTAAELSLQIAKSTGDRQLLEQAREHHREFRRKRKQAIKLAQQQSTDEELDAMLDQLEKLPRISPAATLLNNLTGNAA